MDHGITQQNCAHYFEKLGYGQYKNFKKGDKVPKKVVYDVFKLVLEDKKNMIIKYANSRGYKLTKWELEGLVCTEYQRGGYQFKIYDFVIDTLASNPNKQQAYGAIYERFIRASGQYARALTNRRKKEYRLITQGIYSY